MIKLIKRVYLKIYLIIKYIIKSNEICMSRDCIYLINTPEHANLGDHMIVIATLNFLNIEYPNHKIIEITHNQFKCTKRILLKKISKDALILIPGGGYLGDLWENEQIVVCNIIESFPKNKIIIFPQTVFFNESSKIRIYRDKFRHYSNVDLFLRDKASYNFMLDNKFLPMDRLHLTPDIVISYPFIIKNIAREGVLLCMRNDKEKTSNNEDLITLLKKLKYKVTFTDTISKHNVSIKNRKKEVEEKLMEFSMHKLVITDRLHGMIFAYLTNTPCIAFDNLSKKVSGVYEWIKDNKGIICVGKISDDKLNKIIETIYDNEGMEFDQKYNDFLPLKELLNKYINN